MTLNGAIQKAHDLLGPNILRSDKIISVLDDFGAFRDVPAYRNVLQTIIRRNMLSDCLYVDKSALEILIYRINLKTGLQIGLIKNVVLAFRKVIQHEKAPQDNDKMFIGQHLQCVYQNGKWGYINERHEIIVPFNYSGISVVTVNGIYAAATDKREFYDTLDRDIYWDGEMPFYLGVNATNYKPLSLMFGDICIAKGAGHHYTYTERTPKTIRHWNAKYTEPAEPEAIQIVSQYAEIPDSWRLYNQKHQPISKEYSNIFLCDTDITSLKNKLTKYCNHPMFNTAKSFQAKGLIMVKLGRWCGNSCYGVIDFEGNEIINPRDHWTKLKLYKNSIIAYYPGSVGVHKSFPRWAEYDFTGYCLHELREEYITAYDMVRLEPGGMVYVTKNGLQGIIKGNLRIPVDNLQLYHIEDGCNYIVALKKGHITIYGNNLNIISDVLTDNRIDKFSISSNTDNGSPSHIIINMHNKENRHIKFSLVVDSVGKVIIPPTFGHIKFRSNGVGFELKSNGKVLHYDINGIIE